MKKCLFLTLMLLGTRGVWASPLLEYECANTVYQSKLTISEEGKVKVDESCFDACSDHTFTKNYDLSQKDFTILLQSIQALPAETYMTGSRDENNCLGEVFIFRNGEKISLRSVEQPELYGQKTSKWNTAPIARVLEQLAFKYVKQKM